MDSNKRPEDMARITTAELAQAFIDEQVKEIQEQVREYARAFARELHVCGLMNMQLAVKDGEIYIIEVNPRASRTVPFVSKATGVPLAAPSCWASCCAPRGIWSANKFALQLGMRS